MKEDFIQVSPSEDSYMHNGETFMGRWFVEYMGWKKCIDTGEFAYAVATAECSSKVDALFIAKKLAYEDKLNIKFTPFVEAVTLIEEQNNGTI